MGRTDQTAKVAAHTFLAVKNRSTLFVQSDGLMTAIGAGYSAAATAKAGSIIKFGEKNGIPFQYIGGIADGVESKPCDVFYGIKALCMEIVIKTCFQIFNYTIRYTMFFSV